MAGFKQDICCSSDSAESVTPDFDLLAFIGQLLYCERLISLQPERRWQGDVAQAFLEEGHFEKWEDAQATGMRKNSKDTFNRTVGRSRPVSATAWCILHWPLALRQSHANRKD